MCARYTLTAEEKEILKGNQYTLVGEYKPDTNIAITDFGFVITSDEPDIVQRMSWGIIPPNAESKVPEFSSFNIRSEDILDRPTFATLLTARKTCLVIADGFYEAEHVSATDKRPWRFLTERKLFCFAGLWSEWIDPITKEPYRTYAIITCEANNIVGEIHPDRRMPVILYKSEEKMWLNKKISTDELLALCIPYPDEKMNRYRVSKKALAVSTKERPNKGKDLTEPVEDEPRQNSLFEASEIPRKPSERKFKNSKKKGNDSTKPDNQAGPDLFNSI